MALVLAAGVAGASAYYHSLQSNMVRHDLDALLDEEDRPEKIGDAVNILFIGSDGYEEDTAAGEREFEGERSDSLMLAHITPDSRVTVISFPRDSLVHLPQCDPYGQTEGTPGYFGMINTAMYHGGPPCVVRTVESLSGIRVDHFVHLGFVGFRDMVDAVGGVDMCIPEPLRDRRAKLDLDAGEQTLDGEQALAFVRARYEIGDGGDIGRIDRQQMFMGALADQVASSDVLTSPSRLTGLLQAVTRHTATDEALTLNRLVTIGTTLADIELSDIEFHTVPWYPAPANPNRVLWDEAEAERLFAAIRNDRPAQGPPLAGPGPLAPDDAPTPDTGASPDPDGPPDEASPDLREYRDATANPCSDGLGTGTEDG